MGTQATRASRAAAGNGHRCQPSRGPNISPPEGDKGSRGLGRQASLLPGCLPFIRAWAPKPLMPQEWGRNVECGCWPSGSSDVLGQAGSQLAAGSQASPALGLAAAAEASEKLDPGCWDLEESTCLWPGSSVPTYWGGGQALSPPCVTRPSVC